MSLDTLAMAFHLTGGHAQAIALADRALALLPATDADVAALRQELETHLAVFRQAQGAGRWYVSRQYRGVRWSVVSCRGLNDESTYINR